MSNQVIFELNVIINITNPIALPPKIDNVVRIRADYCSAVVWKYYNQALISARREFGLPSSRVTDTNKENANIFINSLNHI